jgi:adenosylcobyric acid synthase
MQYNANNQYDKESKQKPIVVVVAYPHIAIADDLCPLESDPRFEVQWRRRSIPPAYPYTSTVVLPGSRLTRLDLKWLHDSGWADFLKQHVAAGGNVLGLCGGYQMLGRTVNDPLGVEGNVGSGEGLDLLPLDTTIAPAECKIVTPRQATLLTAEMLGVHVEGFELHCGQTELIRETQSDRLQPLIKFDNGETDGYSNGQVKGTYLHGILRTPEARKELLVPYSDDFPVVEEANQVDDLDRLADHLTACGLDFDTVVKMLS